MPSIRMFAAVVLILGFASCSRDPEVAKRRYLQSGDKYFEKGKFKEARIMYKDALQKDQRFGQAYYKLGLTAIKLASLERGSWSEPVQALKRAVELLPNDSPEHWDAAVKLSEIYLALGGGKKEFADQVEGYVKGLLARDPNSFDGHRLNGDLHYGRFMEASRTNRKEDAAAFGDIAIAEYRKANEIKPNQIGVIMQMARAHLAKPDLPAAESMYRQAIALDKTHQAAHSELYQLLIVQRKLVEGEQVLKSAFDANPKEFKFLASLAAHYFGTGRRDEMLAVVQRIKSSFKEYPDAYLVVGNFYLRLGDGDSAIREFREGATHDSKRKATYDKYVIEVLLRQGKRTEAAELNTLILKENPNDNDAKGLAATMLLDKGETARALAELQAVVTRAPDNAVARFNLGRAHAARGEIEQARQAFQKAIEIKPDLLAPRLALAQLQVTRREFDAALRTTAQILAIDRNNFQARLIESAALMGQKKFGDSRSLLDSMAKVNPGSPDVHFQMGVVSLAESKFKEADEAFRKSYQLNPANLRGLLGMVETQMAQSKPDAALKILQDEAAKNPRQSELVLAMANTAARAGRWDQAISYYNQALTILEPDSRYRGDIYLRIGESYRRKGDDASAIANLQKARELRPESVQTLVTLALVLDHAGRWSEGKAVYEAALKLDANHGVALNNLAFLLAEHGGDLDEALNKATRAKQLMPNMPEVADTVGWIYLKKNLADPAIEIFRELVQKAPNQATFRYHLGMALSQKGDKPKAIKELQEALKYNPAKTERDKIQELLNRLTTS